MREKFNFLTLIFGSKLQIFNRGSHTATIRSAN